MSSQRRHARQTQPKTFRLSLRALLSFPYRLCNPPPAVAKVRSCSVTPAFQVRLEDVLNRKHLPPLGLKDFEEWLLYIEQSPENLYFVLWLKEYTLRYNQWALQLQSLRAIAHESRLPSPCPTSPQLAMFYARAKQTFFTPNSDYELNIPSGILSPFHNPKVGIAHPDPAIFAPVVCEVQRMLNDSLKRFVHASYTNVGTNRALCGMVGGCVIALLGTVAPIVYNIVTERSRWLRLTALPGMWLGLTILIASLHGVCMMIYLFGDLRQLRTFELSRPPISRPQLLTVPRRRSTSSSPPVVPPAPITRPPILPLDQTGRRTSIVPPPPLVLVRDHYPLTRTSSVSSGATGSCSRMTYSSGTAEEGAQIEISSACFHDDDPDITAVNTPTVQDIKFMSNNTKRSLNNFEITGSSFATTASFIHQYDPLCDDDDQDNGCENLPLPEHRQAMSAFDFDCLPSLSLAPPAGASPALAAMMHPNRSNPPAHLSPISPLPHHLNDRTDKITVYNFPPQTPPPPPAAPSHPNSPYNLSPEFQHHRWSAMTSATKVNAQFKKVRAVPAFASPLTRILNPVVARAQWEIVIRSAFIALGICWIILGCLLAVPVHQR